MTEKKLHCVYALVESQRLHPHEEYEEDKIQEVLKDIVHRKCVCEPVLVDDTHMVILNGHHRYESLKRLNTRYIPVFLVNYDSEDIKVERWPNAKDHVSKEEVIRRGISGQLYPPKTSKHMFSLHIEPVKTKLEILY
jgi:endo-1,4-beta-D-glucanase Y